MERYFKVSISTHKIRNAGLNFIFAGALLASLSACTTPTTQVHGRLLEQTEIQRIQKGQHSKGDVIALLGSPTIIAPFDENTWHYVGAIVEQKDVRQPKVTKQKIVTITFTPAGMVSSIKSDETDAPTNVIPEDKETQGAGKNMSIFGELLYQQVIAGRKSDKSDKLGSMTTEGSPL